MVGPREVAVSTLALMVQASAFRCPHVSGALVLRNHAAGNRPKGSSKSETPTYRRPRRASTAVRMVSDREQELKDKIAKLRGAASKGDTYERVVGKGSELKDKMEKSKGEFDRTVDRERQDKLRANLVVKGDKDKAVSELEAGRRTIVRDPDDPMQEANILDDLMVSREEDLEDELRAAYAAGSSSDVAAGKKPKFDGAYGSTMQGAEAFFNKPSPFQKAAKYKEESAAASASASTADAEATAAGTSADARVLEVVESAEAATETTGTVIEDSFEKVTGSVGGRWEKPKEGADVDTHKPAVSTWGVFERPKDMSKAFGGGRDPTLKRLDPEEKRRRDEETKAILNSYRGSTGEDLKREKESETEIKAALAQSKRAMKFGDTFGAVSALEGVKQECSIHGPLGAVVFLELAMALEATGRSYQAQDIYKVLRRSKNREIKSQAKRLNEGLEAMDMLKFGRVGEVNEVSEVSKMWTASFTPMSGDQEKKYSQVYYEKDADGRPSEDGVFAVEDAKQVLTFASKYKGGISKNRIIAAFDFLKQRSEEASLAARREASLIRKQQQQAQDDADAAAAAAAAEKENGEEGGSGRKREKTEEELFALKKTPWEKNTESTLPQGGAGLVSLMGDMSKLEERIQGGWKLTIKAGGSSVDVLQRDSPFVLNPGGKLTAVEPSGPLLSVTKEGEWKLDADNRVIKLDFSR
ncbi:unnamed protein product [Ectocarpus sp. CCAP 1310/34]|nr:unnamed protein product [Ectocarpus sp. CCAP 1310/34]